MTTKTAEYALSVTAADDYEPFVVGGQAIGEVHWIRTEGAVGATLVVDLESGETVTLRPGDVASFAKGTKSMWTVTQPFKKLFIISG